LVGTVSIVRAEAAVHELNRDKLRMPPYTLVQVQHFLLHPWYSPLAV